MPDLSNTEQQVAVLVGFFLPLVLSVVIQSAWSKTVKAAVSIAAYAGAGVAITAAHGDFTGRTFWQAALTVAVLGVVGYQGVWKPLGAADKVETATNI